MALKDDEELSLSSYKEGESFDMIVESSVSAKIHKDYESSNLDTIVSKSSDLPPLPDLIVQAAKSMTSDEDVTDVKKKNGKEINLDIDKNESESKIPELPMYVSSTYTKYKGYGSGPPGPKRYKSDEELITPPRGRLLGDKDIFVNKLYWSSRLIYSVLFGWSVFAFVAYGYITGLRLLETDNKRLAMGLYGAFLFTHLSIQAFFANLEQHKAKVNIPPDDYNVSAPSSIALQISAYQEDPDYFRECIEGIMKLEYPKDKFKVLCFIDGNSQDSCYMVDIFEKVVKKHGEEPVFFWWDYNYHELPEGLDDDENGVNSLVECIAQNKYICLMQKWGGKREVMYTAFKSLRGIVDYVQVCDSDTKLDPMAVIELAWVLDNEPNTGAVGGDVKILNEGDSYISFLSGLRYWMAFNVERACQSYFGCVSCISGPLGLYRMSILEQFLDLWSDQKFLGEVCTFGDDRHLTNRMLQMGFNTKYTARSFCLTETPAQYLRWLSQQIRWTKSYFREWLFNSMWWHKQSLWCVYENVVAGAFPFYVISTMIITVYSGNLWNIFVLLLTIQFVGVLKGFMAGLMRRDMRMVYMSLYSSLYITSLLPAKIFAILTIRKKGWGTSGRKTMLTTYNELIPPLTWLAILLPGLVYTFYVHDYSRLNDDIWLGGGIAIYVGYWALTLSSYIFFVQPHLAKKSDFEKEGEDASDGSPTSSDNSPSLQHKVISSKITTTGFFGHSSDDSRSAADELYDISLDDIESQKSNMRDLALDEESVQTLPPDYLQPVNLPIEQIPIQNEHKKKIIEQENTYKTIEEVFDSINECERKCHD